MRTQTTVKRVLVSVAAAALVWSQIAPAAQAQSRGHRSGGYHGSGGHYRGGYGHYRGGYHYGGHYHGGWSTGDYVALGLGAAAFGGLLAYSLSGPGYSYAPVYYGPPYAYYPGYAYDPYAYYYPRYAYYPYYYRGYYYYPPAYAYSPAPIPP